MIRGVAPSILEFSKDALLSYGTELKTRRNSETSPTLEASLVRKKGETRTEREVFLSQLRLDIWRKRERKTGINRRLARIGESTVL